jgi:hypothetical protein
MTRMEGEKFIQTLSRKVGREENTCETLANIGVIKRTHYETTLPCASILLS